MAATFSLSVVLPAVSSCTLACIAGVETNSFSMKAHHQWAKAFQSA